MHACDDFGRYLFRGNGGNVSQNRFTFVLSNQPKYHEFAKLFAHVVLLNGSERWARCIVTLY